MRILLDYRPALRERTGVGEYVHHLARALATTVAPEGPDAVSVFSASWKDRPSQDVPTELPGVRVVHTRCPVRALTWSWNRLEWPHIEWLAGEVDVVHAQTPLIIPSRGAAQVITIHDLHFLERPDHGRAEMRRDFPVLVRDHARRADHIVVSSRHAASTVCRRLAVSGEKVSVCAPGAPPWAAATRRDRSSGGSGAIILFVGTIEPRKNIDGLLAAYVRLRARGSDAPQLVLAGRVTEAGQPLLLPHRSELGDHLRVLGYVSEEVRRDLYRQAQMLVLPSFDEGFGLPVLEAMACGVPVVVSTRGSLPEVAGDAARPVDPDDHEGLASEMDRLLSPAAAGEAAERGIAQAARYTWDACATATRAAYRKALTARAGRRP